MPATPTSPRVKLRSASRRVPRTPASGPAPAAEQDAEPTMPLSRAILVIFLLHIVAIGGYLSFTQLSARRDAASGAASAPLEAEDAPIAAKSNALEPERRKPDAPAPATSQTIHVVRPGETPMRIANENGVTLAALVAANGSDIVTSGLRAGQEIRLPEKSAAAAPAAAASGAARPAANPSEARHPAATPAPANPAAGNKPGKLPADSGKLYTVGKRESAYTIAQKLHVSAEALLKLNHVDDPRKLQPGQKLHLPPASKEK